MEKVKVNLHELKKRQKKNFEERLQFIKFWADYIKKNPNKLWSSQQKLLIDSQLRNAREIQEKGLRILKKAKRK